MAKAKKKPEVEAAPAAEPVERWLPIPGYCGIYEVSDAGRVRSNPRVTASGTLGKDGLLKPQIGSNGYARVQLSKDGKVVRASVQRLVLITFVGPASELAQACHWNGIRSDNRLANLRWGSPRENALDCTRHGTRFDNRGDRHPNRKYSSVDIERVFDLKRFGHTQRAVAKWLGISESNLCGMLKGRNWKHITGARA